MQKFSILIHALLPLNPCDRIAVETELRELRLENDSLRGHIAKNETRECVFANFIFYIK